MSIIESLKKLIDPLATQEQEELRRAAREVPAKDDTGAPPEYMCRVCGHRSADAHFCSVCLAGTMERAPPRP